jgi:hypothetical protein
MRHSRAIAPATASKFLAYYAQLSKAVLEICRIYVISARFKLDPV